MLQDIRELTGDPEAYAAELRRRWGGLLSYRYIGRFHASMDNGPADETVTLRRDMRNPTGGCCWRCSASPHRTAAASPIWRRCRTPSSTPARSSTRAAT